MIEVPKYLEEVLERYYSEGMLRTIIIRTPSSQFWGNLSSDQQVKWKELIAELGADPEAYLSHMRKMLPSNP